MLLVGALIAWFLIALFQPPPFDPGEGSGQAIVTIPAGASASDVAELLADNDVVSNRTLFEWRLKLAGKSDEILPGRYVLAHEHELRSGDRQADQLGRQGHRDHPRGRGQEPDRAPVKRPRADGDYLAATKSFKGFDPNQLRRAQPEVAGGLPLPGDLRGRPGADVGQLVSEQLQAFQQNFGGVDMSYAKSKNLTVYDVLKIASMIDKEVMVPSERPLVAAVIYNRLHRGMPLGIDATTRYEFHNYTDEITASQLKSPSAYNTRVNAGLTPTPIGNPGLDAIQAAAHPAKVNYLYYVLEANGGGQHCFTASGAEFNQLVAAYNAGQAPASCRS